MERKNKSGEKFEGKERTFGGRKGREWRKKNKRGEKYGRKEIRIEGNKGKKKKKTRRKGGNSRTSEGEKKKN